MLSAGSVKSRLIPGQVRDDREVRRLMSGIARVRPVACAELACGAVAAGYAVLCTEGAWAWSQTHAAQLGAPAADGVYGEGYGEPLTLVLMGDSLAAGIGADQPGQTPGALLAAGLARAAGSPVRLYTVARGGARTRDLPAQLEEAKTARPAAAVIVIGGNDITHMLLPGRPALIEPLRRVVAELVSTGAAVLVATCPDVGTVPPVPQPLRALARRASRAVARVQAVAALAEGARTVSLGYLLGPVMRERPAELFAADHFHPSPAAYAIAAQVMLPPLLAALQLRRWPPQREPRHAQERAGGRLPLAASNRLAVPAPGISAGEGGNTGPLRGPAQRWNSATATGNGARPAARAGSGPAAGPAPGGSPAPTPSAAGAGSPVPPAGLITLMSRYGAHLPDRRRDPPLR
jgi:lysophospholipase L1-like esterase